MAIKGTTRLAVEDMDLEQAREEYRRIRARAWQCAEKSEFDAKVSESVGLGFGTEEGSVERARKWVLAARVARFTCRRCGGTGRFITGSLNGELVGPGGPCYRCEGKGWQDDSDARRNYGADIHQRVY